jgi:hypothetical protein
MENLKNKLIHRKSRVYNTAKKCLLLYFKCFIFHVMSLACLLNLLYSIIQVNVSFHFQYPVILLAGEATHKHYFSTTHGAYETGQAQAKVILDYIHSERSSA